MKLGLIGSCEMDQERFKQWSIGWRDPLYTFALFLGCVCLLTVTVVVIVGAFYVIPAIKDWRHASNATTKVYESGLTDVQEAAKSIRESMTEVTPTLRGLQGDEAELQEYIKDLRGHTALLTQSIDGRLQTFDEVLIGLRQVSDETRSQIKQNGDATAANLISLKTTLDDAGVLIRNTDREVTRILQDGALILETANPKIKELLDHADNLVVDTDGTIRAYQPIGENLSRMTKDSADKWHNLLFPASVKGFWPNVRRITSYAWKPVFDGARLYYTIHSLPIHITRPISIKP